MANINEELSAILEARLGKEVRGSIHDAIKKINDVEEVQFDAGVDINDGDPVSSIPGTTPPLPNGYEDSLYINTSTYSLLKCDGSTWHEVANLEGNSIISITGPVTDGLVDTYTINFSKSDPVTFDINNGRGIESIIKTGTNGLIDTYTITYNDGTTQDYIVTNGKDGNTVHRGNEVTGGDVRPTQFTLTVKCQAGDTYINTSGEVYECTQGADAGGQSLWKYNFSISGGGTGGAQFLYDLSDIDSASVRTPSPNQILQYDETLQKWMAKAGGNGHNMRPTPTSQLPYLTEAQVVQYIQSKLTSPTNDEVASIFSIGHWTNVKTRRIIYDGQIGHTGIGTWKDGEVTAADEADWWMNTAFTLLDNSDPSIDGYDVDFSIKMDPGNGEVITLGGYIIDTTTGKICIRFANYVIDPSNAKIAVDITFTRTDVG